MLTNTRTASTTKERNSINISLKGLTSLEAFHKLIELINYAYSSTDNRLSEAEIGMLKYFMDLPTKFKYQRFGRLAKKKVTKRAQEEEGWTLTRVNINNKIYEMIRKGFLRRDEDMVVYLSPSLEKARSIVEEAYNSDKPVNINFSLEWQQQEKKNNKS